MPKIDHDARVIEPSAVLKPYLSHGLDLQEKGDEASSDCPFCGREGKFRVNLTTSQWRCFGCNSGSDNGKVIRGGNAATFLQHLWKSSEKHTKGIASLAADRKLLDEETLVAWGVRRSLVNQGWVVPGYNAAGKLTNLYRYAPATVGGKKRLLATAEVGHALFGVPLYDASKPEVWLCEGIWDAMALWEVMRRVKQGESGYRPTSSESAAMLSSVNVLAAPGCNVFEAKWLPLFSGKRVTLLYDSDHPRLRCLPCKKSWSTVLHDKCPDCEGELTEPEVHPAGYDGMRRVAAAFTSASDGPSEVRWLKWGQRGYDEELPSGFDVRDYLSSSGEIVGIEEEGQDDPYLQRAARIGSLFERVELIPPEWVTEFKKSKPGEVRLLAVACKDWKSLRNQWRKGFKWPEPEKGLDHALPVMLAVSASTMMPESQLWCKIVSPPSSGKTELCEGLSVDRKHVYPKDTMTGLFSGYQTDKEGTEDVSLAPKISGKTLVIKDGDTLLQLPNLMQVLSQFRALYDRSFRTSYGNKMSRDHEGLCISCLLCGTESIRKIDESELGERFLDCVIMERIDPDTEQEINRRKFFDVVNNRGVDLSNGNHRGVDNPALIKAKQMTGGYVAYLRDNAADLLSQVEVHHDLATKFSDMAAFVAHMRARPSKRQDDSDGREMSTRLLCQLTKLGLCLAVVLNKQEVDAEVLRRVRRVALDTARGRTLSITRALYSRGDKGSPLSGLAHIAEQPEGELRKLLPFLRKIGAVEKFVAMVERRHDTIGTNGTPPQHDTRPRWRLTERMRELYKSVNNDQN